MIAISRPFFFLNEPPARLGLQVAFLRGEEQVDEDVRLCTIDLSDKLLDSHNPLQAINPQRLMNHKAFSQKPCLLHRQQYHVLDFPLYL